MPTLNTARVYVEAREAASLSHYHRQARDAVHSGMGPTSFTPATPIEIDRQAEKVVADAETWAASPRGRFFRCVEAVRKAAEIADDEDMHAACVLALACYSRGLDGELDHARRCLAEIDTRLGDVRAAVEALDEIEAGQ